MRFIVEVKGGRGGKSVWLPFSLWDSGQRQHGKTSESSEVAVLLMRFFVYSHAKPTTLAFSCRSPYEILGEYGSISEAVRDALPFSLWDSHRSGSASPPHPVVSCRSPYEILKTLLTRFVGRYEQLPFSLWDSWHFRQSMDDFFLRCRSPYEIQSR